MNLHSVAVVASVVAIWAMIYIILQEKYKEPQTVETITIIKDK